MIDWIDESGKVWGVAKRRVLLGGHWFEGKGFHEDGFSARSVVGKLWEEREGAGQGANGQKVIEVFLGDALAFETAMHGAYERWYYLAHYRYVIPSRWLPGKSKLAELREMFPKYFKDDRGYYDELHSFHCYLLGRMPDVPREPFPAQKVRTICAEVSGNASHLEYDTLSREMRKSRQP